MAFEHDIRHGRPLRRPLRIPDVQKSFGRSIAVIGSGVGLWLITITGWWSLPTVLSPLLMTYFLVYATGARLTEKYMAGRSGFDEYKARTSFFVPRPPRSTRT